jgi:hypothetical protein
VKGKVMKGKHCLENGNRKQQHTFLVRWFREICLASSEVGDHSRFQTWSHSNLLLSTRVS